MIKLTVAEGGSLSTLASGYIRIYFSLKLKYILGPRQEKKNYIYIYIFRSDGLRTYHSLENEYKQHNLINNQINK